MHASPASAARSIARIALLAAAALGAGPAVAAGPEPPIVHDPEAAAELAAAFAALRALPSYRETRQDLEPLAQPPQIVDHLGPGRMRLVSEDTVGQWKGTTETIVRPGRAATRFVSPDLDAYLARLEARQRRATLLGIGGQVRQILQAAAMGPAGVLSAVQGGLSLLGGARGGLSLLDDADVYGKWHCVDLPELPIAGAAPAAESAAAAEAAAAPPESEDRVERLPATTLDGEPVRGYRSATEAGGATMSYRTWVLESNGLPRKSEMSIEMPGFSSRSVLEFSHFGAAAEVEAPPCLDGG